MSLWRIVALFPYTTDSGQEYVHRITTKISCPPKEMLLGQVRRGMLVWDPFVGTGSILVAAAHLGAQTFGTDIDIRVIKWGELCTTYQKLQQSSALGNSKAAST